MQQAHEVGHDRLVRLAYKGHAAAATADVRRLERAAQHFDQALQRHLRLERAFVATLSPRRARMLGRGQSRLCVATHALLDEVTKGCAGCPERCAQRADTVVALLARQARDEHVALHRQVA